MRPRIEPALLHTLRVLGCCAAGFLLATPLAGQEAAGNPHGPLTEGLVCTSCHTTEAWSPLRSDLAFDHVDTGFPLSGAHVGVTCAACHEGIRFGEVKVPLDDCASCHLDVHIGAFQAPCIACHTTDTFDALEVEMGVHPADFPLEGAHLMISCASCHLDDIGGAFAALDSDCASCHLDAFQSTILLDHEVLGFSTDCMECHTVFDWRDVASFDHEASAPGFPLIGAHASQPCESCHTLPGGEVPYAAAGADDCVACHQSDFDGEHAGSGFPTDCTICHTPSNWDAEDFDHDGGTTFPLVGVHNTIDCAECHLPGVGILFQPQDEGDCVACHQVDFDDAHAGTGSLTDCAGCHAETTWGETTFDHDADFFPIDTGPHSSFRTDCSACHTSPADITFFTCLTCHEQPDMDDKHSGESGYVYASENCLSCHPDGQD